MADEQKTEDQENQEDQTAKKNKKIRFMNAAELDKAIEKTTKNQGGLFSRYARELVKRRDYLQSLNK